MSVFGELTDRAATRLTRHSIGEQLQAIREAQGNMQEKPKELRCGGTMHGKLTSPTHLEVRCKRRACGKRPEVVVLHTFDLTTGDLLKTERFADPSRKDIKDNGTQ